MMLILLGFLILIMDALPPANPIGTPYFYEEVKPKNR